MSATSRLFSMDKQSDVPTIIIDFGSLSSDISIYDKAVLTTGTIEGGGEVFTDSIQKALGVTRAEAAIIKTKYGLGKSKKQATIQSVLDPILTKIIKEIERLMRYHTERYGSERPIQQIITLGGGANMPGLSEHLTNGLRLAVRTCDPWQYIDFKGLQPPTTADKPMYATAAGLSLVPPEEVFND